MPRGKWVNHKGRSRHFTSPEELQLENEKSSEEETSSEEEEDDDEGAAGPSSKKEKKKRNRDKKMPTSSEEETDEDDMPDRDAKKGVASLIEIENPNRAVKKLANKVGQVKIEGAEPEEAKPQLSRREREQIEQQKALQRYEKMHAAGKTDEARADLARLAIIRQQRAEAAAKREAEKKALEQKKSTNKA